MVQLHLHLLLVVWRSTTVGSGELSVMIPLDRLMLMWHVTSLVMMELLHTEGWIP